MRIPALILFFSVCNTAQAEEIFFSFAWKTTSSQWASANPDKKFNSRSRKRDISMHMSLNNFYGGLNLAGANYYFSDQAPDHPIVGTIDNAVIQRGDADLILGYYFWKYASLFIGSKTIRATWKTGDSMTWSGGGIGATSYYPLSENFILFGSLAAMPLFVYTNDNLSGEGGLSSFDLGIRYVFNRHLQASVGLRSETLNFSPDRHKYVSGGYWLSISSGF